MSETQFVIYYRTAIQISPDDWDTITKMKSFNEKTTLGEVRKWYNDKYPKRVDMKLPELKIQEIESKK